MEEAKRLIEYTEKYPSICGVEPHVYSERKYAIMKDTIERMVKDG